ncbi:MAG: hypothetical protein J6Y13_11510 [Treponema sp.]|nr:hypothetical protein [Treponema sp.]
MARTSYSSKFFLMLGLALSLSFPQVFAYDFSDEPEVSGSVEAESLEELGALREVSSGEYSFGTYPQSLMESDVVIDESETMTAGDQTYYLGSDGSWYQKVVAAPRGRYSFSDGTPILKGKTYYFKVEPVKWTRMVGSEIIVSNDILTARRYGESRNDYETSEIREFLNEDFIDQVFTRKQKRSIAMTEVDNSAESTSDARKSWNGTGTNSYASSPTKDMIFLLSEAEITSEEWGFKGCREDDDERIRYPTDYALAVGAYRKADRDTGWYWLRSPYYSQNDCYALAVTATGFAYNFGHVSDVSGGVAPALTLSE